MPTSCRSVALAQRGPRHRVGWAALAEASEAALAAVDDADPEEAAWAVLAAEAHLLLAVDGRRHRSWIVAARVRLPDARGELALRLWLSEVRSALLRGEVAQAVAALDGADAISTEGALAAERAVLGSAARRSAGDVAGGAELADRAVALAAACGERHVEAQAWVQVGEARLDEGVLDAAEAALGRAIGLAHGARCERTLGFAMGDVGRLCEARGDVQRALAWYDEALSLLRSVGAARLAAWFQALRVRLQVRAGLAPADAELEAARESAWAAGDLEVALSITLDQARLLAASGEPARASVRARAAQWAAEAAGLTSLAGEAAGMLDAGEPSSGVGGLPRAAAPGERGAVAPTAGEAAADRLDGAPSSGAAVGGGDHGHAAPAVLDDARTGVVVAADLSWLRRGDVAAVSLERRGAARRVLRALLDAEGATRSAFDLIDAGWPGERMDPSSALQRLYTTIRSLRKLGLEDELRTVDGGYRLTGVARAGVGI